MQKKSKFNVFIFMMFVLLGLTFQPAISSYATCPEDIFFYLKLDETAGPTYEDFIKDNDGTGSANVAATTDGILNGAQEFNGTDTEINVDADNSFDWKSDESFSIEFWVKTDNFSAGGDNQVVIGRTDGPLQWWVGINGANGRISFFLRDRTGAGDTADLDGVESATNPIIPSDGSWHHVVAVRDDVEDNNTNFIYVDGVLQGSSTFDYTNGFGSSTAALNIGHLNSNFYFDGLIDEVALYDRALTVTEIQEHSDAGQQGNGVRSLALIPRYRLYNPFDFKHHYTTDLNEYNTLGAQGWNQEGIAYYVYDAAVTVDSVQAVPFYRLYNPNTGKHHWTTDANENNVLGSMGWTQEGIDGYIFPSQVTDSVPLYRLYNPFSLKHLWTTDLNERTVLVSQGWNDEGIAGYVFNSAN